MPLVSLIPVAPASTLSSVAVALHAPGIGGTLTDADVLPRAGQAVSAPMKPPPHGFSGRSCYTSCCKRTWKDQTM